jgi:transposase InsO family protein
LGSKKSRKDWGNHITSYLLARNFQATKPNEKWVTDITEFHLYGEKIRPFLTFLTERLLLINCPVYPLIAMILDKAFK